MRTFAVILLLAALLALPVVAVMAQQEPPTGAGLASAAPSAVPSPSTSSESPEAHGSDAPVAATGEGTAAASAIAAPSSATPATATDAVAGGAIVRGVFFFSPTCPHCELVITEHLPGLFERFGGEPTISIDESLAPGDVAFYLMSNGRLQLLMVDVSVDPGSRMFVADSERLGVDAGVPRLDIAERSLVGSVDIPRDLPGIVAGGLAADGIAWPPVPDLASALAPFPEAGGVAAVTDGEVRDPVVSEAALPAANLSVWAKVTRDPLANGLAIVVLVLLVGSLVAVPLLLRRGTMPRLPDWPVPLLALVGIGISAYLGSVESSGGQAVCGPVGDCNAVQDSEYARLAGVPMGVVGVLGYAFVLAGWIVARLLEGRLAAVLLVGIAAGALAGTVFSAWLTFLEALRHRRDLPLVRELGAHHAGAPVADRGARLGGRGPSPWPPARPASRHGIETPDPPGLIQARVRAGRSLLACADAPGARRRRRPWRASAARS